MRNDGDQYANLQRLNSAVLARYQWTSSLIGMQKTPEEIHQRRNRNHRKVNEFIQELIDKRSGVNALDDQGALERYRQFQMRHKIDDDDLLDEFNRRLRSLTRYPRTFRPARRSSLQTANSTSTIDIQTDDFDTTGITDRSTSPIAFSIDQTVSDNQTKSFLPLENSFQTSSSLFHRTRTEQIEGREIILHCSSSTPPIQAASNVLLFNNSFFPRSLTTNRHPIVINEKSSVQPSSNSRSIQQFDREQVFHMLDQLDRTCSQDQFTDMLSNLRMTSVKQIDESSSIETQQDENEDEKSTEFYSNLFDKTSSSEKYFQHFTLTIDKPEFIRVYAMTIGTMKLTSNVWIPYSILDGHRPVLQISNETNFKRIRSKKMSNVCRVTAIDTSLTTSMKNLKKNDIVIKINDQTVWQWDIENIRQLFVDLSEKTNQCSLTIIRLNQPFSYRCDS